MGKKRHPLTKESGERYLYTLKGVLAYFRGTGGGERPKKIRFFSAGRGTCLEAITYLKRGERGRGKSRGFSHRRKGNRTLPDQKKPTGKSGKKDGITQDYKKSYPPGTGMFACEKMTEMGSLVLRKEGQYVLWVRRGVIWRDKKKARKKDAGSFARMVSVVSSCMTEEKIHGPEIKRGSNKKGKTHPSRGKNRLFLVKSMRGTPPSTGKKGMIHHTPLTWRGKTESSNTEK